MCVYESPNDWALVSSTRPEHVAGGDGGGRGSAAHEYDALNPSSATLPSDVNCTVMLFPVETVVGGNDVPVYRPSCALASTAGASNTYT